MAAKKFKYNINHVVSYQPKWLTIDRIAEYLEKAGIPRRTFDRDKAIKLTDLEDIPGERLFIYAKFFGVDVIALFNYDKKVKVLDRAEPKPSESISKMMKRTNLKVSR